MTIARIANSRMYRCSKRLPSARLGSAIVSSRLRMGSNAFTAATSYLFQPPRIDSDVLAPGNPSFSSRAHICANCGIADSHQSQTHSANQLPTSAELNDPGSNTLPADDTPQTIDSPSRQTYTYVRWLLVLGARWEDWEQMINETGFLSLLGRQRAGWTMEQPLLSR